MHLTPWWSGPEAVYNTVADCSSLNTSVTRKIAWVIETFFIRAIVFFLLLTIQAFNCTSETMYSPLRSGRSSVQIRCIYFNIGILQKKSIVLKSIFYFDT
jgi:hypothetical protein